MPVETFNASYNDVWVAVETYLINEKDPIVMSDQEDGLIVTDWVIMEKVFGAKRYHYEIEIKDLGAGQVAVGIASPQEKYEMGDWEDMLPTERRANRIFKYIERNLGAVVVTTGVTNIEKVSDRPYNKRQWGIVR